MIVETETIKNEVFMDEEGAHRYLLQRTWGEPNAAIVAVITLKPGSASPLYNGPDHDANSKSCGRYGLQRLCGD